MYVGLMSGDLFPLFWSGYTDVMKYMAIVSCLLFALVRRHRGKAARKNACGMWTPLHAALLYAVCADFFLLFTDAAACGILLFCGVQFGYAMRLHQLQGAKSGAGKQPWAAGAVGIALAAVVLLLLWDKNYKTLQGNPMFLPALAALYVIYSMIHLIRAGRWMRICAQNVPERGVRYVQSCLLFCTILLLLLCDIHVALCQLQHHLPAANESLFWGILSAWGRAAGPAMWLFYLPSQICVVLQIDDFSDQTV